MEHYFSCMSLFFTTFLIFPSLNSSLPPSHPYQCYQDDQKVLLEIKKYFNNSTLFTTWIPGTDCCRSWRGIACKKLPKSTTHRVYFLEIDGGLDIVGTIPSLIADLPYLESLIFRSNPNLTGTIPPAIGKLTRLSFVLLNWNNITGTIPNYFNTLTNLSTLELNDNQLTGSIPSYLGRLTNLGVLNLANNQLTGTLPASLGFMVQGSLLTLTNNMFSGPLPRSMGNINYQILELSGNKFTGDASFLFGENKIQTYHLNLANNGFSFDLTNVVMPVGESNTSLLVLDLSHNMIYGQLPAWLGVAPLMYSLDVSYNQLCGPIPTQGGKLQGYSPSSFEHNKCLCGAPLPPCKS